MLIPPGTQNVLKPSVFAMNGTMPLAFTLYGLVAYSAIASLFLLIEPGMRGTKQVKGLKYGLACSAVWIIYLLEPFPHVAPLDRLTYPLADSAALIVMGIVCGLLLATAKEGERTNRRERLLWLPYGGIAACFMAGRLLQYGVFHVYSSFHQSPLETMLWCILTALTLSWFSLWSSRFLEAPNRFSRALIVGGLLFGVDLFFFNFFMPLVFEADLPDLLLRTATDTLSITAGCCFFLQPKGKGTPYFV